MPGFDQAGPQGMGQMIGGGFGPCGMGLGWRRRFGMGRGMGRYFYWNQPRTKEEQKKALADYRKALEEELEDLKKEEEKIAKG